MMHGWRVVVFAIVIVGFVHVQVERPHVEAREGDNQNNGAGGSENSHVNGALILQEVTGATDQRLSRLFGGRLALDPDGNVRK
jgi:hypothetical protein